MDGLPHVMRQFEHTPIERLSQQIRLVSFDFTSTRTIKATLHQFDIDELPAYQALSYAWGPADTLHNISIDRCLFQVRPNLLEFLQVYLRREELQREYIWIDQICIDQTCVEERNRQVQLMGKIYSRAERVLVWLGMLPENVELDPLVWIAGSHATKLDTETWTDRRPGRLSEASLFALEIFSELPYWSRHWILQEILLAKSRLAVWGDHLLDLEVMNKLLHDQFEPGTAAHVLDYISQDAIAPGWILTGGSYSKHFMGMTTHCTDMRDKVYGIQSLLTPELQVTIDYFKNVEDVYLEQVFAIAQHVQPMYAVLAAIEALAHSMRLTPELNKLSSWVTNFYLKARNEYVEGEPVKPHYDVLVWKANESDEVNKARIKKEVTTWLRYGRFNYTAPRYDFASYQQYRATLTNGLGEGL